MVVVGHILAAPLTRVVLRSNSLLSWRHENKQNLEASRDKQEDQQTEEQTGFRAKKKVREEKKSLKRQVSEKDREEKQIKVRSDQCSSESCCVVAYVKTRHICQQTYEQ